MKKNFVNKKNFNIKLIIKIIFYALFLTMIIFFYNKIFVTKKFSKYFANTINSISIKYEYVFQDLEIKGISFMDVKLVKNYFNKYIGKSIFLIPISDISKKLHQERWIKSVSIESNFKNKITILIDESKPIGVYDNNNNYLLIDEYGNAIDFIAEKDIHNFIRFKGNNADNNIPEILMNIPNSIKPLIEEAEYIGNRRWNVVTKDNILIKLPEKNIDYAFSILNKIYNNFSSNEKDNINLIDLRIPKKAVIKFNE